MYLKKLTLESLPKQLVEDFVRDPGEEVAKTLGLKQKPWVYPQALQHASQWRPYKLPSGLYSGTLTLKESVKTTLDRFVWKLLTHSQRFLLQQYRGDSAYYCKYVPLVLASFKKYHHIPYSEWDPTTLEYIVDEPLLHFMLNPLPQYPEHLLLEWRVEGLTVKSGVRKGEVKSPLSTYGVYGLPWSVEVNGEEVEGPQGLTALQKMAILQTWCAHPQNRNEYMILDPQNWDQLPPPLISSEPLSQPEPKEPVEPQKTTYVYTLPWEQ